MSRLAMGGSSRSSTAPLWGRDRGRRRPLSLAGFDRIEAIQRFLSALHGRAIPPDTRLTRQQRARLRRMLRAFDGHRAGATQQEIARVLLNTGRRAGRMAGVLGPSCHQGTPARRPFHGRRRLSETPASSPPTITRSFALMVGDFDTPNFALQLAALPAPPWSLPAADPQRPLATPRRPDHAT